MVGGAALDGQRDDLPGLGVGLFLAAGLDLLDLHGGLVGDIGLQLVQQVVLGLFTGKAGDPLQSVQLVLLQLLGLGLSLVQAQQLGSQLLLPLFHVFGFAVQVFFLLLQAVLLPLKLAAALTHLALVVVLGLQDLLLGLQQGFPLLALGTLIGIVDDLLRLVFGGVQIFVGLLPLPQNAEHIDQYRPDNQTDDGSNYIR